MAGAEGKNVYLIVRKVGPVSSRAEGKDPTLSQPSPMWKTCSAPVSVSVPDKMEGFSNYGDKSRTSTLWLYVKFWLQGQDKVPIPGPC